MEGISWDGGHCLAEQEMVLLKESKAAPSRSGHSLGVYLRLAAFSCFGSLLWRVMTEPCRIIQEVSVKEWDIIGF